MAKALYGHLAADPVLLSEVGRLRRRVRELEDDLARLRAENAERAAAAGAVDGSGDLSVDELIALEPQQEPALT